MLYGSSWTKRLASLAHPSAEDESILSGLTFGARICKVDDGWFDHVSPPTAPNGTPGEWLTAKTISAKTNGIRGPLGLGVRVPMTIRRRGGRKLGGEGL